jgi:hypothetical protein
MSVLEEVVLNWTDLTGQKTGATALGSNKFYKAELSKDGSGFKVVFTYGRVGQSGQTQVVKAKTLDADDGVWVLERLRRLALAWRNPPCEPAWRRDPLRRD